ncbi:MAG: hypothetical protein U1F57_04315 [bacterium]
MLTREEKALRKLLRFFTFLFALGFLSFLFFPRLLFEELNFLSLKIAPTFSPLPVSDDRFWLVLALSLMAIITALCYGAQSDVRRKKELAFYVLIGKAASSLLFTVFFFTKHSLPYLFGTLVDGSIFWVLLIFYKKAVRSSQLML